MVFSSSATVYGQPEKIPCVEDFELKAMNPYGRTKLFLEEIARDIQKAEPDWSIILLRYFNPVGAHESGKIGEDPKGIPNNLMPYIQQVAVGRLPELNVYGHDYPTKDGSAVRDYIHVMDLADGHIAAVRKLFSSENIGDQFVSFKFLHIINLSSFIVPFGKYTVCIKLICCSRLYCL
ncbi:hypothetical protein Godav_029763 [Gossypium davidsonii]|uniref:NAD-dependent epimerase/dehydratase domain-containing protein n=1 Tax=Gossypium davidsonii TaxID=34287 RepID=A0A7J8T8U3_GOSDV|nr:hypothetical protein [Gossypium davidsonii]